MSIPNFLDGYLAKEAQNDATAVNRANSVDTNDLNRYMFELSKGAKGNALLPMFFGNQEINLADTANKNYYSNLALAGTPEEQYKKYADLVWDLQPAIRESNQTVKDVFNGDMTLRQLGYQQAVNQARSNVAFGQKQSIYESLNKSLAATQARDAMKGFTGGDSFAGARNFGQTLAANQAAAGVMGQANLANAQDIAGIQNMGQARALQNISLPFTQAQQNIALSGMPMNAVWANQQNAMQPYNWFKTTPSAFQATPFPTVQPNFGAAMMANAGGNSLNTNLAQGGQLWQKYASQNANNPRNYATAQYSPYSTGAAYGDYSGSNYGGWESSGAAGGWESGAGAAGAEGAFAGEAAWA